MTINMFGTTLNLNETTLELTGKTFELKTNLKTWGCTFNPANKSWILPEKNKQSFLTKFAVATVETVKITTVKNTVCPKCGTYCYGDCQS